MKTKSQKIAPLIKRHSGLTPLRYDGWLVQVQEMLLITSSNNGVWRLAAKYIIPTIDGRIGEIRPSQTIGNNYVNEAFRHKRH
jgi:hypothetical protein